jgi:hypothetical protein
MQDGWRWTLVRIDANSGNVTSLGLDDSHSRFDAEFTADGNGMVAVSSAGGIFNLEFVDPASRSSRRITNVAGAAFAPAITPGGDSAYFVALRADGYEIRRISLLSSAATPLLTDLSLTPAVTLRPRQLAQLDTLDPGPDKPYGFGPQRPFWLPLGGSDAQGAFGGALFSLADPVGRLGAVLTATAGNVDAWRGVSLKSEWRGWPVQFGAQLHLTGKRFHVVDAPVSSPFELRYSGAQLAAQRELNFINRGVTLSTGVWAGALEQPGQPSQSRTLGFVNLSAGAVGQSGAVTFAGNFSSNFEAGSTAGENWNRLQLSLATAVRSPGPDLSAFISAGLGSADGAPMEQYLIGGDVSPHLDPRSSSNFVAAPVLRNALLAGDRYLKARAELAQFLPTTFYGEWVWPGGNAGYFATVGTFVDIEAPRLPQLALPSITGELGVGIVVAGPHARRAATYLMLRARP